MTHKSSLLCILPCIPVRVAAAGSSASLAVLGLLVCAAHVRAQTTLGEVAPESAGIAATDLSGAAAADKALAGLSATEWSSIRAAYDSNRRAAVATADGFQAHNPGQHWLTRFDRRGVSTQPDAGGWTWGLQLERYGFAGDERDVCEPMQVSAQEQRVAYDWDPTLQEWWVNDARGLEHGYTVRDRPPHREGGLLTFTLAVLGDLQPRVQDGGRGVRFSNADGVDVLTYAGLSVSDADGQTLVARFERNAEGLHLRIDEGSARYPLTIDPLAQQAYLKASNTDGGDEFGSSLSISGDTVVVGAPSESSNATGVNGNQLDNSASSSGAAYVFVRSGTTWSQQAYLKASNTGTGDQFGVSVSISGDTLVVGAFHEDSNAVGVNDNQANNSAPDAGAAYVFVRSGTTWSQQAYLKASNTDAGDLFGWSVSAAGDTVVVGAPGEASNSIVVNGNQLDNSAGFAGAAYVYVRNGTTWSQQAYLKASNTDAGDVFGWSVSVSGDTGVVGAINEASNATGVNGNQLDNSAGFSGAAYVFARSGTTWSHQAYLKASNTETNDSFGGAVSVSGGTVVVGAVNESSNATGVNGNQADNSAFGSGAVYVFEPTTPPTPFCFGDGTGTACPCGNNGIAGNGCANSVNAHGARLSGSGSASIAADSFVLSGGGMPNSSALYFQGTTQLNGGLGTVFGDGLRCAGGSVIRLGTETNALGASHYPTGADPAISVKGLITAPGSRTYQIWYRNAAAFCNPETFNLSNGLQVTWGL